MTNLEILEDKYIELLLKKCINFNNSKSLFINYDKVNKAFVEKVIRRAKEMGVYDIGIDEEDIFELRDKLNSISLEEIEHDDYFNKRKWDEYALKNASFLMFTTEFPHVLDGVEAEKVSRAEYINRKTRSIFRKRETSYEIPWCIAALPSEIWAKNVFPNSENAYEELYLTILKFCMADTKNPIESWNTTLINMAIMQEKLTQLEIKKMWYKNSLGTDLTIELPENCVWNSAAAKQEKEMFVNMPSFEVFTSPDFRKTNGIVYSTKPLMYNGGLIDKFFIEFKEGKAISYYAKVGRKLLTEIFKSDEKARYLGEAALVDRDTPICKSNLILGSTLLDENSSPHLALGDAFAFSIRNAENYTEEELIAKGLNLNATTHVDFMIGSSDLNILADTKEGPKLIFKNGKFNL